MRQLTEAQTCTLLAALRHWQSEVSDAERRSYSHFDDLDPLDNEGIEQLCELFNGGQSDAEPQLETNKAQLAAVPELVYALQSAQATITNYLQFRSDMGDHSVGVDPAQSVLAQIDQALSRTEGDKKFKILNKPLTRAEATEIADDDNYIEVIIPVALSEIIRGDLEAFLDLISKVVTGTELLMDSNYELVGMTSERELLLRVSGDISMCYEND